MRGRVLVFGLAAIIIIAVVLLSLVDGFFVDLLWFGALGFRHVFTTEIIAEVLIFVCVWLIAFVLIGISALVAVHYSGDRERLRVVRRPEEMVEVNLPELIRALGERVPWRLLALIAAAVLAIFVAQGEAGNWATYLKAFYGVPFGVREPAFGRDVGFYVFALPLLEEWRDLLLLIIFLAAAVAIAVYWVRGSIDFRESPPTISRAAAGHLSVLLGAFFVQRAFSYWLGRFELTLHTNGVVFGLRYVDHLLWQPGLWLLVVLSLIAAVVAISNLSRRGLRLPVIAAIIVFGPALVMNLLQPVIEGLYVKPNELAVERPYLERNIAMTRRAYALDQVDVRPFPGHGKLTLASLGEDEATIKNIRLWDPRPLIATYRQLQEIRLYYDFKDVDIDRYTIDDKYTQVMLSAREMNVNLLPPDAQTWVNRHLKYTHGNGLVMSPVNAKDAEGLPIFYINNIPPHSDVGFNITQPGIYFGQEPDNYCVVKASSPEFDYPKGSKNIFSFYKGTGGVQVSGFWRRLLFSFYYRDINLLVTTSIINGSRIMLRRNISDRIATLAPFLNQDRDPYMVVHNGRLVWIMDCYTTSDHYPYSQLNSDQINYIRNSVKAVVDAYNGTVTFYVSDPEDPVIRTWERIFPHMFVPMTKMPPDLRRHIRYPEDYFLIQADIYRTYHMTDPAVFYNREDLWSFPRENYADQTVTMQPYYVIMRLPGQTKAEYILMLPMCPKGRDNMISWLAARCDGSDYGHLFEFSFSKDRLFYGPYQIQARINQNPNISQQYSLWNQMGSKVILGNLIVIPIENALLYVEPLYIRARDGQLPELQRVLASYSDRTVMADDLDLTLQALFATPSQVMPIVASAKSGKPAAVEAAAVAAATQPEKVIVANSRGVPAPDLETAADHYDRALAALRSGDWTAFGAQMQSLGQELKQPAAHH